MQMSSNTSASRPAVASQANSIIRNWDLVAQGFEELRPILRCYVVTTLKAAYGEDKWWNKAVRHSLTKEQQKSLEGISNLDEREKAMDVSVLLRIITKRWDKNFRRRLVGVSPKLLEDLSRAFEDCEREARRDGGDCSSEDADRWLHEMQKLCKNTSVMSDGLSSANTANRIGRYRKAVQEHGDARREALPAEWSPPVRVAEPQEQRSPAPAPTPVRESASARASTKSAKPAQRSRLAALAEPVVSFQVQGAADNGELVDKGLDLLGRVLVPYVDIVLDLEKGHGKEWWQEATDQAAALDGQGPFVSALPMNDPANADYLKRALHLIDVRWDETFCHGGLSGDCRFWARELNGVCKTEAGSGAGGCSDEDAYRWLDNMQRLCRETTMKICNDDTPDGLTNVDMADRIKEFRNDVYVYALKDCEFATYVPVVMYESYGSDEDFIRSVLRLEAPIQRSLVQERLAVHRGYAKAGTHDRADASRELNKLVCSEPDDEGLSFNWYWDKDKDFIYPCGDIRRIVPRRRGERSFSQIAPKEIDAGVLQFLSWLGQAGKRGIPEEVLLPSVYSKFAPGRGEERLREDSDDWRRLEDSLERLEKDSRLRVGEEVGQTMVYLVGKER